jgi:hypothetical protein
VGARPVEQRLSIAKVFLGSLGCRLSCFNVNPAGQEKTVKMVSPFARSLCVDVVSCDVVLGESRANDVGQEKSVSENETQLLFEENPEENPWRTVNWSLCDPTCQTPELACVPGSGATPAGLKERARGDLSQNSDPFLGVCAYGAEGPSARKERRRDMPLWTLVQPFCI